MPAINFAAIFRAIGFRGAIAIIALIALAVVMWRADAISESRDKLRTALATEEARHAVTRQSVDTLTLEMKRLVEEGEARAERVDKAMQQVAEDTAPLKAEAERIEREGLPADYVEQLQEAGV
ncbi:MAG: hypothetical protein JKY36_04295 [Erythrobacter sp.]|nr:hypothetical protein [Erythrobacter sp.]